MVNLRIGISCSKIDSFSHFFPVSPDILLFMSCVLTGLLPKVVLRIHKDNPVYRYCLVFQFVQKSKKLCPRFIYRYNHIYFQISALLSEMVPSRV